MTAHLLRSWGRWTNDNATAVACLTTKCKLLISSDVTEGRFKSESGKFKPFSGLTFEVLSVGEVISDSI